MLTNPCKFKKVFEVFQMKNQIEKKVIQYKTMILSYHLVFSQWDILQSWISVLSLSLFSSSQYLEVDRLDLKTSQPLFSPTVSACRLSPAWTFRSGPSLCSSPCPSLWVWYRCISLSDCWLCCHCSFYLHQKTF